MKILIVEDEINAFQYLRDSILKIRPDVQIQAHLESVEETVNWLLENPSPDLIFLDIELSDGRSFEIFEHVQVQSPIIFTTAYDQYAIEAFKLNSIGYLLKPIHVDDLRKALEKYERSRPKADVQLTAQLQAVFGKLNQQKKQRCLVKKGNHFEFINIADVACVHSDEGLTFLHTFQGQRHFYTSTVEGLMAGLDGKDFFQINRGQIVNINAIQKIHPFFNQRMKLDLSVQVPGVEFLVSRSNLQEFREWVDS
ncbi:MAG: response regulator transcription factor [Lewinellaceae bacterium]|nr:response regulator transcription factor [Saprospiraceae bacterium]MCB9336880.1 response regulator transcription factor [Lewinellaceae bacterium]